MLLALWVLFVGEIKKITLFGEQLLKNEIICIETEGRFTFHKAGSCHELAYSTVLQAYVSKEAERAI